MATRLERDLWWYALLTYGVGDVLTTNMVIERMGTETEANPVARWLLEEMGGDMGLVGIKAVAMLLMYGAWWEFREDTKVVAYGVPGGIAVLGTVVVANNMKVLNEIREE